MRQPQRRQLPPNGRANRRAFSAACDGSDRGAKARATQETPRALGLLALRGDRLGLDRDNLAARLKIR